MNPNKWLELVKKHAYTPEEVDDSELATLRTNYTVWLAAIQALTSGTTNAIIAAQTKALNNRTIPKQDWMMLASGIKPESVTESEWLEIFQARAEYNETRSKLAAAKRLVLFYQAFDEQFTSENGAQPAEVREVLAETRVRVLETAIRKHRNAHVMANKQPNGYDFLLWQEIGEDEFYASSHAELAKNGYISFKE